MWPHKEGLGVRLSYGVNGNGLLNIKSNNSELETKEGDEDNNTKLQSHVLFPRIQPIVENQYYVSSTKKLLKTPLNSSILDDQILNSTSKITRNALNSSYIPNQIISSYGLESSAIESKFAYDPIFGDIVKNFNMQCSNSSNEDYNGLIYVTGSSLSILNFAILVNFPSIKHMKLSEPYEIDFLDNIRQIDIKNEKQKLVILVRTNNKIYVLTSKLIQFSNNSKSSPNFDISIIKEINSFNFDNSTFADVSIYSNDIKKFAIIDISGNLAIWEINEKFTKCIKQSEKNLKLPLSKSQDLSNWVKLNWIFSSNESSRLLVSTRTKTYDCDMINNTYFLLMTSDTWSRLRDVCVLNNYIFYLTSKELIWFKIDSNPKNGVKYERLLSWKHFLNDDDPSLKCSIMENDDIFSIFIFSQISPIIIVYTFGFQYGKAVSLQDPYILKGNTFGLKQILPMKDGNSATCLVELSSNLNLSVSFLQHGTSTDIVGPSQQNPKVLQKDNIRKSKPNTKKLRKLYQYLADLKSRNLNVNSDQILQQYATALSSKFESESQTEEIKFDRYTSILEIENKIPLNINDIYELDDLIVQLKNSTYMENLDIKSFINNGFIQKNGFIKTSDSQSHIFNIYQLLQELFKTQNLSNSIINTSIILGLSLIKFEIKSNNVYKTNFETTKSESSEKVQELLDLWDEDETFVKPQQPTRYESDVSSQYNTLPTLKSSQVHFSEPTQPSISQLDPSQNSRMKRQAPIKSSLSQPIRSSQLNSQSSSQQKRKKKKTKGFG
ncbi:uncharacterized protein KGF55_001188 [Candida pseudojiufengensis]|uniref:uncharacterized protein n=1 Tax=Candida pseudojiufengensis TaxID=497109 RepID=UPI002224D140|nr:uncharacterized protein KGF55_001188 [Candida pseudojiufengensis]KAI5965825.1 hypothetical protein KGF55_001188 [Candida pseudojiufengensis]